MAGMAGLRQAAHQRRASRGHENDDGDGLGRHHHERREMARRIACWTGPSSLLERRGRYQGYASAALYGLWRRTRRDRFISGVEEDGKKRAFDPARDMDGVAGIFAHLGRVKLIVIVPIDSPSKGDSHKNAETRRDLQPVVDLAEQTQAIALGMHHLTKRSENDDPLDRVSGSLPYGAAPARVLLSAMDPAQAEPHGVVMRAKSNIGPPRGGFAFKAEMRPLDKYTHVFT